MNESSGKTPREILFRGKHLKKWRFGNCVIEECSVGISNPVTLCRFTVYPETVGQYTGLKDKNGKRIFEGDIVLWRYTESSGLPVRFTTAVSFEEGSFIIKKPDKFYKNGFEPNGVSRKRGLKNEQPPRSGLSA